MHCLHIITYPCIIVFACFYFVISKFFFSIKTLNIFVSSWIFCDNLWKLQKCCENIFLSYCIILSQILISLHFILINMIINIYAFCWLFFIQRKKFGFNVFLCNSGLFVLLQKPQTDKKHNVLCENIIYLKTIF